MTIGLRPHGDPERAALRGMEKGRAGVFQGERFGNQFLKRGVRVVVLKEVDSPAEVLRRVVVYSLDREDLANDRFGGDGKRAIGKDCSDPNVPAADPQQLDSGLHGRRSAADVDRHVDSASRRELLDGDAKQVAIIRPHGASGPETAG